MDKILEYPWTDFHLIFNWYILARLIPPDHIPNFKELSSGTAVQPVGQNVHEFCMFLLKG